MSGLNKLVMCLNTKKYSHYSQRTSKFCVVLEKVAEVKQSNFKCPGVTNCCKQGNTCIIIYYCIITMLWQCLWVLVESLGEKAPRLPFRGCDQTNTRPRPLQCGLRTRTNLELFSTITIYLIQHWDSQPDTNNTKSWGQNKTMNSIMQHISVTRELFLCSPFGLLTCCSWFTSRQIKKDIIWFDLTIHTHKKPLVSIF